MAEDPEKQELNEPAENAPSAPPPDGEATPAPAEPVPGEAAPEGTHKLHRAEPAPTPGETVEATAAATAAAEIAAAAEPEPQPVGEEVATLLGKPGPSASAAASAVAAPEPQPRRVAAFVYGLVGALIGVALALGIPYALGFRFAALDGLELRIAGLGDETRYQTDALKTLEARVREIETRPTPAATPAPEVNALAARLAKLEALGLTPNSLAALRADVEAARAAAEAPRPPSTSPPPALTAELDELAARVAKLEALGLTADLFADLRADVEAARAAAVAANAPSPTPLATPAPSAPDPRIGKLAEDQTGLSDRFAKLSDDQGGLRATVSKLADTVGKLGDDQTTLSDRFAKLSDDQGGLRATVSKLADTVGKLGDDQTAQSSRVAKLEAMLNQPKSETRAPIKTPPAAAPAAAAVAALVLEQRLVRGEPYPQEFATLSRIGADPDALAALKPFADAGAPTAAALVASFAKIAPSLAAPPQRESGGGIDKLMASVGALVRVRPVGEVKGDDPAALVTQVQAGLGRGDVGGAMAAYAKLPDSSRAASAAWAKDAESFVRVRAAAEKIIETSLSRLAATSE